MSFRCDRVSGSIFVWHTDVTEKQKWEALKDAPESTSP